MKFAPLEVIEAGALADHATEPWWNQTLCQVNDSVARIGVFHGEFHWHKHDKEDELFFVLEGTLLLDIEGKGTSSSSRARAWSSRRASSIARAPVAHRRADGRARRRRPDRRQVARSANAALRRHN